MNTNQMNVASSYFNANWQRYKDSVQKNTLFHHEMFAALDQFLDKHFGNRAFSLVDVGCGDSASIEPVLVGKSIAQYIGIDEADVVLQMASSNLAHINCDKQFIAKNMITAIKQLPAPVDIIFTSYAVHHLSHQEKYDFIADCKSQLKANGFLLMVDGVLEKNTTRNEWLDALQDRIQTANTEITHEELLTRMTHPRAADFPEEISEFDTMAKQQGWSGFNVLVDKGIFAFMVFSK